MRDRFNRVLLPAAFILLVGCGAPADRMITADGLAITGELSGIDGTTVVFSGGKTVTLDGGAPRVFLADGTSLRGSVSYSSGTWHVGSDSGGRGLQTEDIEMLVWSSPVSEDEVIMEVHAWSGWVYSGIDVRKGDLITVEASGTVTMETGTCGPEGLEMYSTTTALVPGATNGQLVMMTGEEPPVAVGASWSGPAPGDGRLQFAVNLPDAVPEPDNGGVFTVVVVRSDGPGPGTAVLYPGGGQS